MLNKFKKSLKERENKTETQLFRYNKQHIYLSTRQPGKSCSPRTNLRDKSLLPWSVDVPKGQILARESEPGGISPCVEDLFLLALFHKEIKCLIHSTTRLPSRRLPWIPHRVRNANTNKCLLPQPQIPTRRPAAVLVAASFFAGLARANFNHVQLKDGARTRFPIP